MRRAIPAPTSGNWDKDLGLLSDEGGLLFRREHQVAVALPLSSQSCKDAAADAGIRLAHMRALYDTFETERNTAEVGWCHSVR